MNGTGELQTGAFGETMKPINWNFQPSPKTINQRSYKCPWCKGEFDSPASRWKARGTEYFCPFCGKEMKGMNK